MLRVFLNLCVYRVYHMLRRVLSKSRAALRRLEGKTSSSCRSWLVEQSLTQETRALPRAASYRAPLKAATNSALKLHHPLSPCRPVPAQLQHHHHQPWLSRLRHHPRPLALLARLQLPPRRPPRLTPAPFPPRLPHPRPGLRWVPMDERGGWSPILLSAPSTRLHSNHACPPPPPPLRVRV